MAERSVVVRMRAEVGDFKRAMAEAAQAADKIPESTRRADTALGQMVQSAQYNREAWDRTGRSMAAFGAATVAGLALSAKAAVDWESQWTGVTKTVNGSAAELDTLEGQLREMARTLPATHEEIAAVAEAAGQLGIQTPNIASFTRTMIDLGETTNLSAQDAATGLARFANVMGTSQHDFDRLGSVLVGLGNNFATTESEILAMSQRLASASRVVGLNEAQTLGLAAAMSSVGIEAEAGGSAVSRVMIKISQAVDEGGSSLDQFAQVAGTTASDFAERWRTDPVNALLAVVQGLAQMTQSGQGTFGMLQELGLNDIRVTNAMLSLSNAVDLTNNAVAQSSVEWERNNALANEAAKRYDTAQAKIQIAKNSIDDAAISLGQTFLPAIADAAQGVADFAAGFAGLPRPVQGVIGVLGGVVGTLSLVAGGFLLVFPRVMDTVTAFRTLRATSPGVVSTMGRVASTATMTATAFAAVYTAGQIVTSMLKDVSLGANEVEAQLDKLAAGSVTASDLFGDIKRPWWAGPDPALGDDLERFKQALRDLADPSLTYQAQSGVANLLGLGGSSDAARLGERLKQYGESLGQIATTDLPRATQAFKALSDMAGGTEEDARRLLTTMPDLRDALIGIANGAGLATDDTTLLALILGQIPAPADAAGASASGLAAGVEEIPPAVQAAKDALDEWRQMVAASDATFVDLAGAYQAVIDKNTELAQETADATSSAKDSWQDYYDGTTVSAEDYIAQLQAQVDAQAAWEQNILDITKRVADGMSGDMRTAAENMIDELIQLGPEGAAQIQLLHDMSDEQFAKVVELWSQKGTDAVTEFTSQVEAYRNPVVDVSANLTPANQAVLDFLNQKRLLTILVHAQVSGGVASGSGLMQRSAEGGEVLGPYLGPTADNVMIRANPREWVQPVAAVDFWGPGFMESVRRRDVASVVARLPRFAEGGPVSPSFMVAPSLPAPAQAVPSLMGLEVSGTLDTPWGPAQVRGVVRDELGRVGADLRRRARMKAGV